MKFLTTGLNVAFEEAPKSFYFLTGLTYYANRILEGEEGSRWKACCGYDIMKTDVRIMWAAADRKELIELFNTKVHSLPEGTLEEVKEALAKSQEEGGLESMGTEWKAFFHFRQEMLGPHKQMPLRMPK